MKRFTPDSVASLLPHQVFVFGSNEDGFHGAGAAGLAMRGDSRNTWRQDHAFLKAIRAPIGSPDRLGRWACFGIARGPQAGRDGQSYAICTIRRPGERRSISLGEILLQLRQLCSYASHCPHLEFLVTRIGCGLAGYTEQEIATLFTVLHNERLLPANVLLPRDMDPRA